MEQNLKKGRVKGTVLFTVVSVMMVMVVFLMSTLILTTSAQRRTYYTYFETQAQYAANAALETVQNSVYSDEDFFNWMASSASNIGDVATLDVNFENTDIPISQTKEIAGETVRYVTCEIERLDNEYYWDEKNVRIVSRRTWRISATAIVGTGMQAAESVQAFVVYEPVREVLGEPDPAGITYRVSGGSVTDGTGAGVFASTFSNASGNLNALGPVYSIGNAPVGRINYDDSSTPLMSISNNADYVGGFVATNNVQTNAQKDFIFQDYAEGMEIYGNYNIVNDQVVESQLSTMPTKYNEIPYVYIDGTCKLTVKLNVGTAEQPVNFYAGAVYADAAQSQFNVWGDTFLYDNELTSVFYGNDTKLTQFLSNNIQKANYTHSGYAGGDLISNNKLLAMTGQNGFKVGGDFIFTNSDDDAALYIGDVNGWGMCALTVEGALICAGDLVLNSDKDVTIKGGIYVDPERVTVSKNCRINGVQFNVGDTADTIATKLADACIASTGAPASYDVTGDGDVTTDDRHVNTYNYAVIESLGAMVFPQTAISATLTTKEDQYKALVQDMLKCKQEYTDSNGVTKTVSVGLFPFCSRLDEIFYSYIRWDLAESTEALAKAHLTSDALIAESKACGHVWSVKEKTDGDTTIWVPYTSSLNAEDHSFIEEIETGAKATSIYDNAPDSPSDLASVMPVNALPSGGDYIDVPYYYHDATGAEKTANYNSIYIGSSVIINSSDYNGGTFFIDPSAAGYDGEDPLVIYLQGSFGGELRFLINNTYDSANGDYYADLGTYTDRDQVIIYFDESFWAQKLFIYSTGSYQAINSGSIDYVANPYYPGTSAWNNLTGAEKYKFEYIPNTTVYATAGKTYTLQNDSFISAFVISPNSSLQILTSGTKLTPTFREQHDSEKFVSTNATVIGIGGFVLDEFYVQNESVLLYATDGNRPGGSSGVDTAGKDVIADGDWLINDYKTPA